MTQEAVWNLGIDRRPSWIWAGNGVRQGCPYGESWEVSPVPGGMARLIDHAANPEAFNEWLAWAMGYTDPAEETFIGEGMNPGD
ncbi:MAG: hypothetical protein IIC96_01580 [Chloroflexi bacterium]|nr:hypothetical protein [Chloroflexota bacterium]